MAPVKNTAGKTKDLLKKLMVSEYFVLILSVVYFLIISIIVPSMMTVNNMKNIFSNIWPLLAVAIGQTFVLLLGGIDLSQISVISLTSVTGTMLLSTNFNPEKFQKSPLWGWMIKEEGGLLAEYPEAAGVILAIIVMLAVGTLIGTVNGILIAKAKMPPFMVTLIAQMFFAAVALFIAQSQNIVAIPDGFTAIGFQGIGFIPYALFVTLGLVLAAQFVLSKTVAGRWIYSTGSNARAARVSGVPASRVTICVYGFSGFCAAAGSLLYSGRLLMGRPTLGENMLMDIIGATVIGGTSMFGGKGKVIWTFYGVLFYCILSTSLTQLKLDAFTVNFVKGLVILFAAILDVARTRMQQQTTVVEVKAKEVSADA